MKGSHIYAREALGRLILRGNMVTEKNNSISLWRGVLGGVVGIIFKVAMLWIYVTYINPTMMSYVDNTFTMLIWALIGIPSAVVMGLIIAAVIRAINLRTKRDVAIVGRALLGATLVCALWLILYLFDNKYFPTFANRRIAFPAYAIFHPLLFMDFGVIVGAVSGVVVGRRNKIGLP